MNRRRVLLLAAFAAALGIRLIPIPRVFTIAYVNFQGDSWYHMRRVDALVTDLTQGITSDPYAANQFIAIAPLLDLIMAALVRVFGGGADAMRADMVAALVPPLLGAAVVFPVFGIARRAFGDVAGIWAAFSVALLPGTFLQRSIVGYTDHHVLEVLTTTLAAWALVEAGTRRGAASLAWGVLGGVFVGCYNLSWSGAAFFSGALMLWLALDAATRLLHPDADSMTVPKAFAAAASVGWLMVAALQNPGLPRASMQRAALAATAGLSISLWILGRAVQGFRKSRPALVVLLLAGAGLGILLLARQTPNLGAVIDQASVILRGQGSAEVAETKPLGDVFPNEPLRAVVLFGGTGLFGLLAWPIVAARLLRLPNLGFPVGGLLPGNFITCTGVYQTLQADVDAGGAYKSRTPLPLQQE